MVEFGRKNFFWEKKVLESSETCKDAKKVVQDGRIPTKKIFFGKKKVLESSETCKNAT